MIFGLSRNSACLSNTNLLISDCKLASEARRITSVGLLGGPKSVSSISNSSSSKVSWPSPLNDRWFLLVTDSMLWCQASVYWMWFGVYKCRLEDVLYLEYAVRFGVASHAVMQKVNISNKALVFAIV